MLCIDLGALLAIKSGRRSLNGRPAGRRRQRSGLVSFSDRKTSQGGGAARAAGGGVARAGWYIRYVYEYVRPRAHSVKLTTTLERFP